MEFKFNKKHSKNQVESVVENKFTNELVVDENNKQIDVSNLSKLTNILRGVDKSINTFNVPYYNTSVVPILITSSEIFDDLFIDEHYKNEVK